MSPEPPPRPRGTKPWFVKKLPSRVEVLEGQSFGFICHTSGQGCKPWFIKKLPSKVTTDAGQNVEMRCLTKELNVQTMGEVSATEFLSTQQLLKGKPRTGSHDPELTLTLPPTHF